MMTHPRRCKRDNMDVKALNGDKTLHINESATCINASATAHPVEVPLGITQVSPNGIAEMVRSKHNQFVLQFMYSELTSLLFM
jgi:hypothetical protein